MVIVLFFFECKINTTFSKGLKPLRTVSLNDIAMLREELGLFKVKGILQPMIWSYRSFSLVLSL